MFVCPNIQEIKRLREKNGWSQHQLSLKAGLSGCALSRIESGKTQKINHLRAREIAKALGCRIDDIFVRSKGA